MGVLVAGNRPARLDRSRRNLDVSPGLGLDRLREGLTALERTLAPAKELAGALAPDPELLAHTLTAVASGARGARGPRTRRLHPPRALRGRAVSAPAEATPAKRRPGPKPGSYHGLDPATGDRVSAEMAGLIDGGTPVESVYEQYKGYGAPSTLRRWIRRWRARQ